ncbi:MAG: hypothetical protein OEV48_04935 [Acidobacteriota bacterium]|nr:hypothetical protein [Acidobacteriota bacterium]
MSCFSKALDELQPEAEGRRWIFVPNDQLTDVTQHPEKGPYRQ